MIQPTTLATCLNGLLGFRPGPTMDYPELDEDLLKSSSGRYYPDFHALLTIENIVAAAPGFSEVDVAYSLSEWLKEKVAASQLKVITRLLQKYQLEKAGKSILQNLRLYEGAGMYTDKVIKQGRLVGLELTMQSYRDIELVINGIGTQIDTANPTMKLYFYAPGEAVKTITFNAAAKGVFNWSDIAPLILNGGVYYLLYQESELLGQAIFRRDDISKAPCQSCSNYNQTAYKQWNEYLTVKAVSFTDDPLTTSPTYYQNTNWGLNLQVAVQCALTGIICEKKNAFVDALGWQVAVDLVQVMKYSTRNNAPARTQLSGMAIEALPGLEAALCTSLEALHFDLSDYDSRCLPCTPKKMITYKSM